MTIYRLDVFKKKSLVVPHLLNSICIYSFLSQSLNRNVVVVLFAFNLINNTSLNMCYVKNSTATNFSFPTFLILPSVLQTYHITASHSPRPFLRTLQVEILLSPNFSLIYKLLLETSLNHIFACDVLCLYAFSSNFFYVSYINENVIHVSVLPDFLSKLRFSTLQVFIYHWTQNNSEYGYTLIFKVNTGSVIFRTHRNIYLSVARKFAEMLLSLRNLLLEDTCGREASFLQGSASELDPNKGFQLRDFAFCTADPLKPIRKFVVFLFRIRTDVLDNVKASNSSTISSILRSLNISSYILVSWSSSDIFLTMKCRILITSPWLSACTVFSGHLITQRPPSRIFSISYKRFHKFFDIFFRYDHRDLVIISMTRRPILDKKFLAKIHYQKEHISLHSLLEFLCHCLVFLTCPIPEFNIGHPSTSRIPISDACVDCRVAIHLLDDPFCIAPHYLLLLSITIIIGNITVFCLYLIRHLLSSANNFTTGRRRTFPLELNNFADWCREFFPSIIHSYLVNSSIRRTISPMFHDVVVNNLIYLCHGELFLLKRLLYLLLDSAVCTQAEHHITAHL
uniref:Signal peptide protein n=1 Tax=Heterorhabditis bacteriophora TaxID=37862 RepID=A0A1I7WHV2_HETBA